MYSKLIKDLRDLVEKMNDCSCTIESIDSVIDDDDFIGQMIDDYLKSDLDAIIDHATKIRNSL